MHLLIQEVDSSQTPESLAEEFPGKGLVLLRTGSFDSPHARYSLVVAEPFLTFRSFGSRCELLANATGDFVQVQFGNPWSVLDGLMARYELLEEPDVPFPLGGCFGYWGYELKNFVEPGLPRLRERTVAGFGSTGPQRRVAVDSRSTVGGTPRFQERRTCGRALLLRWGTARRGTRSLLESPCS